MAERLLIDAGGTRVRAFLEAGQTRKKLFELRSGEGAVTAAVRRAKAGRKNIRLVVGMRGVWTAAEKRAWAKKLGGRAVVVSDVELAHTLAFGNAPGIYLNAGTGSIAFGRGDSGALARAGGLGPLLGDDGSAFWIGREYIRRIEMGRASFSTLRALGTGRSPVAAIAAFAKKALRDARKGGAAAAIVGEAQEALIDLTAEVAGRLKTKKPLPLVIGGGLFADRTFAAGFKRRLRARRVAVYFPPVA